MPGGPKLVGVDLDTDKVVQDDHLPAATWRCRRPTSTTSASTCGGARRASPTSPTRRDKGPNGIIVVDLDSGRELAAAARPPVRPRPDRRDFLPVVEGRPLMERPPDGPPKHADAWAPTASPSAATASGCTTARWRAGACTACPTDALARPSSRPTRQVAATVVRRLGDRGLRLRRAGVATTQGRLYLTDYEHNAVLRRPPDGQYETLVHDPRLLWPDTHVGGDRRLPLLHRQPAAPAEAVTTAARTCGEKPYALFRAKIDAGPVLLRR